MRLADRYALWFLGVTLVTAGVAWAIGGAARAVAVLVVATPCPLILAAPVALVSGLSRAARRGIVIKGGAVLERLAKCTTLLIDKTGTLTSGRPALAAVVPAGTLPPDEILARAGSLDQVSPHVLARAVVDAAVAHHCQLILPEEVVEVPGQGIRGLVGGRPVALGKAAWVGVTGAPAWAKAARRRAQLDGSITVFVAVDGAPAGVLVLDDPIRPDAARTIRALRRSGIRRIVMVTGDRPEVADTVGAVIGVDEVLAERAPDEKLDAVRAERRRAATIMVGDGINDAPALALADVGVALGRPGRHRLLRGGRRGGHRRPPGPGGRGPRPGPPLPAHRPAKRDRRHGHVPGRHGPGRGRAAAGGVGRPPPRRHRRRRHPQRPTRPPPARSTLRLDEADAALTRRFQGEHQAIRADLDRLRAAADDLGRIDPAQAIAEIRQVHRLLTEEVQPHEQAEQEVLYPALDRLLGGADPTGPMSRAHVEITHQIRRLGQLLDDIGPDGPDSEDISELRRLLYGLHAVLRLHTAQEEESYFSLADDTTPAFHATVGT